MIDVHTASLREIFDFVKAAILKQGRPSKDHYSRCRYRGSDGTKCAAGHLIPDDFPAIERKPVRDQPFFRDLPLQKLQLITDLQKTHDFATSWAGSDRMFLKTFNAGMEKVHDKYSL